MRVIDIAAAPIHCSGAYFSGIASSSLHGWVWLAMALLGTVVGIRLRPLFGLAVERAKPTGP